MAVSSVGKFARIEASRLAREMAVKTVATAKTVMTTEKTTVAEASRTKLPHYVRVPQMDQIGTRLVAESIGLPVSRAEDLGRYL